MIGLYGDKWEMVSQGQTIVVESDPWPGAIMQFAGVLAAGIISVLIATGESRRRENEQARHLVSEFLAFAEQAADIVQDAAQNARYPVVPDDGIPHSLEDRIVAKEAVRKLDPLVGALKLKGAVAELHVGWDYAAHIANVTNAIVHSCDELQGEVTGGAIYVPTLQENLAQYSEESHVLSEKYGRAGGLWFRIRHGLNNLRPMVDGWVHAFRSWNVQKSKNSDCLQ